MKHQASPSAPAGALPARAGIGLKPQHFRDLLDTRPALGFLEIHAENYMVEGGPFHHYLGLIRERYALSVHGVGLSIGAEGPLDPAHLDRLATLLERYQPESFSEHLAWSTHGGRFFNDLLPLAYDENSLECVCRHIQQVQEHLRRRLLLENPATYVGFASSGIDEAQFIAEVVARTGCGLLLDLNNLHVSCTNHHRDPRAYLATLPLHAVGEIHLAGFAEDRDAAGAPLLIDDHGAPVDEAVWTLYRETLARLGPLPTLIERDNAIPPLAELVDEAQRAAHLLSREAA
ncbi:MNIO family bufferin maturase [Metapseudomonas furukawaii]|uniref:MNIO family bufferin maturase n=1 Tax=Metapseudomonas furukawaii TaxID=1149133 RepID=UPI004046621C